MTEQEFGELLALGHEKRGLEFKGPGKRTDRAFFALVVRAILGMANRQDGGVVVIGVADDGAALGPTGLALEQLDTWTHDATGDGLAEYADPPVEFTLERVRFQSKDFILLRVDEFDEVPVLCKQDYPQTLRKGACYVRARRKPETSEIPAQAEMRELIDLATSKRLRKTLGMLRDAGVDLSATAPPGDVQLFDEQIKDLL